MEVYEILKTLREKNNLTQEEMAKHINITRQAVSRWETGETQPNPEMLKVLSREFNVSINTLLGSPRQLFCQCCGMPLTEDSMISREPDKSFNEDYCKWCYVDGEFIYKQKDSLIDFLLQHMPRPHNKEDLLKAAQENYESLMNLIDGLTEKELNTPFDFSGQPRKKEAHWSRDKNVRDVLIHLYEWHQLLLDFPKNNKGVTDKKSAIAFLPADYSWKTYGAMNLMFWKRHQETSLEAAKEMFKKSHADAMKLIESYSNEELFTQTYFPWTGNAALGDYCVSDTSSHYAWAIKKIKAHKKNCGK